MGSCCSIGIKSHLCKMNSFWRSAVQHSTHSQQYGYDEHMLYDELKNLSEE